MASNTSARGERSPPISPRSSRQSSISMPAHRPAIPSGLRQSQLAPSSPEDHFHVPPSEGRAPEFASDGIHPHDYAPVDSDTSATHVHGAIDEPPMPPDAQTKLLGDGQKYHIPRAHDCGDPKCSHGVWSPRPRYWRGYGSFATFNTVSSMDGNEERRDYTADTLGDAVTDGLLGHKNKKSTTHWLARRHGIRHDRLMYAFPIFQPLTETRITSFPFVTTRC